MKNGEIIVARSGKQYKILGKLGRGGQAIVKKVCSCTDQKEYAYKHYRENKNNIKANIEYLQQLGELKDKNGKVLSSVVLPLEIVEGKNGSFGYIMELVDLSDYVNLRKAWSNYPDCKTICKIGENIADFFEALHGSHGLCYKDVNEGNIFFHPKTGEVKIIDNDNIGRSDKFTIKGTTNYMAPEVVLGEKKPDQRTDSFSLAVYLYRLLVGGYPFDGAWSRDYCNKNDMTEFDAQKVIYGSQALFVWHPTDKRNSIEKITNEDERKEATGQAMLWHRLPKAIQNLFIDIFVTNLPSERRAERPTGAKWSKLFADLRGQLVKCPKCGKWTFPDTGNCFSCEAKVPISPFVVTSILPPPPDKPVQRRKIHKLVCDIISKGSPKKLGVCFLEKKHIRGSEVSKALLSGELGILEYYPTRKTLGLKNTSGRSWKIQKANGTIAICERGKIVLLEPNVKIAFVEKVVQLNVIKITEEEV